jgi:hypothetical protein
LNDDDVEVLGRVLELLVFVLPDGDRAVVTAPGGRLEEVERCPPYDEYDEEPEPQCQLPQERRRRHGSSCAAGGRGAACWAAGCGRHSLLRAGIM